MKQNLIKELRVCINPSCQKEYEARIYDVMGMRILMGQGNCPECAKEAYDAELAKEKAVNDAEVARKRRQWRHECGISPKFMNEDFSTFKMGWQDKDLTKCQEYADAFPLDYRAYLEREKKAYPSLLLFSEHSWGTGKTHLACSIAHRILDRWQGEDMSCPVEFISEPDIYRRIQATYNYSPEEKYFRESEQDILNSLIWCRCLILDDLGKEKRTDPRFVQRILFSIIDGHYRNQRPMVITTNLSQEKLKLYLGGGAGDEASYDRLIEMCNRKFIKVDGQSFRRG